MVEEAPARIFARRAALRELALVVALYAAYSATRFVVGGDWGAARHHALQILEVERWLHIDIEQAVNHAVTPITAVSVFSAYWYATMHFIVTWTVLIVLYVRRPALYRPARTALFAATFIALFGYMFYPTAPPRLTAGFIDTVSTTSQYGWWPSAAEQAQNASTVTNQVAAMPSMHVGWALWVSVVLACLARRRWLKVLAFGYVATTTAVVVLTANHWLLDAVAGGALVLACWWVAGRPYASAVATGRRSGARVAIPQDYALAAAEAYSAAEMHEPPAVVELREISSHERDTGRPPAA
ncbi:phosphatase PAP2 family protein [Cellulomonas sp. URHD0024]|uniref:phosphatase PAP2 family protein n=1 Tax=Cellulomonas sp. URHD0024 TaxID=1302620 RepID=UPI0006862D0D|nr:phosphatase PAP2 family protein [Cellulomonas sp. URHD0024]